MPATYLITAVLGVLFTAQSPAPDLWTPPMPLDELKTGYDEGAPFPTYDGRSLYFSRLWLPDRFPGILYQVTRDPAGLSFAGLQALSALDKLDWIVNYPWVSPNNLRLYYYEGRATTRLIKVSRRAAATDPWPMGVEVPELNLLGCVANPSLAPDERTIVFAGLNLEGGLGSWDLWLGTRADANAPFGHFTNLASVNGRSADLHPRLSFDGLTLYFSSNRNGPYQLFRATRPDPNAPFGEPEHLTFFDAPGHWLMYPTPSADGRDLYFVKGLDTNSDYHIYVSHAVLPPGPVALAPRSGGPAHRQPQPRSTQYLAAHGHVRNSK